MNKITLFFIFISTFIYSQENGKWETLATKKEVVNLNAGESNDVLINLPLGTSKVFYSIKVLKNGSTESITSIADFFSQNNFDPRMYLAAEATKASVKMSDAKIKYSINSQSDTNVKNCFSSNEIVTDEVKAYFDYTNINCIDISGNNLKLYFNFTSQNKLSPLKVVFQIIYFIDEDLKKGWSQNVKNYLFEYLVKNIKQANSSLSNELIEKNVNCILTNLTKDYTFHQFQLLAEYEKRNYFEKLKNICDK